MTILTITDAVAHCREAQAANREISDECARVIAFRFGYCVSPEASDFRFDGTISVNTAILWRQMFTSEVYGYGYPFNSEEKNLLANMMGTYFLRNSPRGPVDGWYLAQRELEYAYEDEWRANEQR